MAKTGPPSWHENLAESDRELLAKINRELDCGENPPVVWERLELKRFVTLSHFRKYAIERRRDAGGPQSSDIVFAGSVMDMINRDFPDLSETERVLIAIQLDGAMNANKATSKAGAARAAADLIRTSILIRRDERDAELHDLKMRQLLAKVEGAARPEEGTGKKVVDLATITQLMIENEAA